MPFGRIPFEYRPIERIGKKLEHVGFSKRSGKSEGPRRTFKKKMGGFRRVSVLDADTKSRRSVMGVACSCRHTISSDYQSKSRVSLGPWPFEGLVDRTRSSDSGLLIAGTTFQMGLHDEG